MNDYKPSRKFLSVDNLPNQVTIDFSNKEELSRLGPRDSISDTKTEINLKDIEKDFNYYNILRRVLYPFALTGAPIGFCLKDPDKLIKTLSFYGILNVILRC